MSTPDQKRSPSRLNAFVRFFKQYMSASSVITASLPIPVTAFRLIPTYSAQTKFLSVYTPVFCFLLLGFAFYSRHTVARWAFRNRGGVVWPHRFLAVLPAIFILSSLALVTYYHYLLQASIMDLHNLGVRATTEQILSKTDYMEIPRGWLLCIAYLGMFLTMEAAFILMSLREYLQDVLGLTEADLILRPHSSHKPEPSSRKSR